MKIKTVALGAVSFLGLSFAVNAADFTVNDTNDGWYDVTSVQTKVGTQSTTMNFNSNTFELQSAGEARRHRVSVSAVTNHMYANFLNDISEADLDDTTNAGLDPYNSLMDQPGWGGTPDSGITDNGDSSYTSKDGSSVIFVSVLDAAAFVNWMNYEAQFEVGEAHSKFDIARALAVYNEGAGTGTVTGYKTNAYTVGLDIYGNVRDFGRQYGGDDVLEVYHNEDKGVQFYLPTSDALTAIAPDEISATVANQWLESSASTTNENSTTTFGIMAVPEPTSFMLIGLASLGVMLRRRRK